MYYKLDKETEQELNKPYLERREVESRIIVNDEYIEITNLSMGTNTINHTKMDKFDMHEFQDKYSEIIQKCRANGVTVHYKKKYKKFIDENWQEYQRLYAEYENVYNKIKEKAELVQQRGIHVGASEDEVLKDICKLRNKIDEYFYSNGLFYLYRSIYTSLSHDLYYFDKNINYIKKEGIIL